MASLLDHIEYLSKEIGARPAGTEEEQQAALYIAEQFQKEASFPASIEEFTSSSNLEGARAILAVVTLVVTVLAMIFGILSVPAFVLAAIAAVIYTLEAFDRPIVSKMLSRGASQNIVAKYQPFPETSAKARGRRTRKVVLVAHYDTGKVTPGVVQALDSTGLPIPLITVIGMIAAAFLLFVRIFAGGAEGVGAIVLNAITILALITVALPIIKAVLIHVAPYNEGANNNASGVAAIIEVARRISKGSVSEADLAAGAMKGVVVHGQEAAERSGLVPEGAQIRYEAEQLQPPEELGEYDEEERLLSAKAAIAALTGKPVERKVFGSVADRLVNSRVQADAPEAVQRHPEQQESQEVREDRVGEEARPGFEAGVMADGPSPEPGAEPVAAEPPRPSVPAPAENAGTPAESGGFQNAPSWFVAAQKNAKRPAGETGRIQRSRYTEAIEVAEREAAVREQRRQQEEAERREAEHRAREEAARAAIEAAQQAQAKLEQVPEVQAVPEPEASPEEGVAVETGLGVVNVPELERPADGKPSGAALDLPDFDAKPATVADAPVVDGRDADPASTIAQAPISTEQLRAEMEAQESREPDLLTAPPAEFTMPQHRFELPTIDAKKDDEKGAGVPENTSPSRSGLFRRLRTDVPSLSGIIRMQEAGEDVSQKPQQVQTPAVPVAAPRPAAPVEEEVDYDMPVLTTEQFDLDLPESDAAGLSAAEFAPEPASRQASRASASASRNRGAESDGRERGGFFSRLRHKKDETLGETPQEWLGVDDDFDARSAGEKLGGWENYRDDQYDDFDAKGDGWNGGAFSRVRLGHVNTRSGEGAEADMPAEPIESPEDAILSEEIEQIYHFRNPLFNTEVWFVAIGSDTELHDGARAFVEAHREELRGSMVIEVESLGLGELAVVAEEGRFRTMKASSRVKRYTRQATQATGIQPGTAKIPCADSITTVVEKAGLQAMHLVGVENGRPALKGSADDVMENIDEILLDENVGFLMELVKRG